MDNRTIHSPAAPSAPRKNKKRNVVFLLLTLLAVLYALFYFVPGPGRAHKAFFDNPRPLVFAHQGGELIAPSNTIAAFDKARSLGVDVLETDIHMTKDGQLVTIHDNTVDRTTNGKGRVDDFTLADLQKLDAGYNFKDLNGEYSYRGKGVYIPSLEELFQRYGDMRLNIEIKDAYPINGESQIERKLWELIQKYHMEDKVLVVSFDQELVKRFDQFAKGRVALAGGKSEITKFVLFHKLFLNGLYHPQVDAVQIPTKESILDLTDAKLINGAHKRNMFVHYWTIDDEQTMRYLLDRGADGIITNRPDILMNVIKDYKR